MGLAVVAGGLWESWAWVGGRPGFPRGVGGCRVGGGGGSLPYPGRPPAGV